MDRNIAFGILIMLGIIVGELSILNFTLQVQNDMFRDLVEILPSELSGETAPKRGKLEPR